jgi:hypothetical protein
VGKKSSVSIKSGVIEGVFIDLDQQVAMLSAFGATA